MTGAGKPYGFGRMSWRKSTAIERAIVLPRHDGVTLL
jgi:hypothetical protein